jgi:hypothetical protein
MLTYFLNCYHVTHFSSIFSSVIFFTQSVIFTVMTEYLNQML